MWVIENDSPRGYYPLARNVKLNYGQDGCNKTAIREVTRPTVKLAPILPSSGGGCCNANVEYRCISIHIKQSINAFKNKHSWPSGLS